ncbi:hypothetical protein JCM5353_007210 [Sporobolomyces roseus]
MSKPSDLKKRMNTLGLNAQRTPEGSRRSGEAYCADMNPRDFDLRYQKPKPKKDESGSKQVVGKKSDAPINKFNGIPSGPKSWRRSSTTQQQADQIPATPAQTIPPSPHLTPSSRTATPDNGNKDPRVEHADQTGIEGKSSGGRVDRDEEVSVTSGETGFKGGLSASSVAAVDSFDSSTPKTELIQAGSSQMVSKTNAKVETSIGSGFGTAVSLSFNLKGSREWKDYESRIESIEGVQAGLRAELIEAKSPDQARSIQDQIKIVKRQEAEVKSDFLDFKGRTVYGSLLEIESATKGAKTGIDHIKEL